MVLLCYDASESRRGAVLLRPFRGRDKIAPQPLVAAEPLWGTRQGQEHPLLLTREIARNDSAESRPG